MEKTHNNLVVLIPTKDRSFELLRLIDCIGKQTIKPALILVCDQTEISQNHDIFLHCKKFNLKGRYLHCPEISSLADARRKLLNELELIYDYAIFFDDDVYFDDKHLFAKLMSKLSPDVAVTCGVIAYEAPQKFKKRIKSTFHRGVFRDNRHAMAEDGLNLLFGGYALWRTELLRETIEKMPRDLFFYEDIFMSIYVKHVKGMKITQAHDCIIYDDNLAVREGKDYLRKQLQEIATLYSVFPSIIGRLNYYLVYFFLRVRLWLMT